VADNLSKTILIVTDFYKPHTSGIITSIDLYLKVLLKNNFKITILTGNHTGKLKEIEYLKNLKIIRAKILFKFSRGFFSLDLVKHYLIESKKHYYVNIQYPLVEIFPLVFFLKKKLIFNYHCLPVYNSFFLKFIKLYFYFFGMLSMFLSNKIIVFSNDYFESFFGHRLFNNKTIEIPPYINSSPKLNYKKINRSKLIIGYLGRLSEEKGLEVLIKSSFLLENKNFKHFIKIAGDLKDGRFNNYINKIKKITKKSNNIKFIGKILESKKINFFNSIDVLVLPSSNSMEAFGLVQLEAMSHGIPVIVSNLKGVRIPVMLTKNGYVFQNGDAYELANLLIKVFNNIKTFNKNTIKNSYLKHYNKEKFDKEYLSIFNKI